MVIFMKKIQGVYKNTLVIQKSEFITELYRVNCLQEIEQYLEKIRKRYYDATHHCYAYILGNRQEIQKCSDDGEPQKTAGAPMLDVLKKNNLTDILAVTTRYFGGILLGAGGLVRAYSSSVSECLKSAKLYEIKPQIKFRLTTTYAGYNTLNKVISYIQILESAFTAEVILTAVCDKEKYSFLEEDLHKYKIAASPLVCLGEITTEVCSDI